MKKFLLLSFFLLFGVTTTSTFADDAVAPASVNSAVAATEIDTLEWSIFGGPAVIVICGRDFNAYGSGSIQVSGLSVWDVGVKAADGFELKSHNILMLGHKIVVYAEVGLPGMP